MSDYEIGYKKPPKHTQFKRGLSGNPKGRGKRVRNVHTILEDVMQEKIVVKIEGVPKTMTKAEAAVRQYVHNGLLKGDKKALETYWKYYDIFQEKVAKAKEQEKPQYVDGELMGHSIIRVMLNCGYKVTGEDAFKIMQYCIDMASGKKPPQ